MSPDPPLPPRAVSERLRFLPVPRLGNDLEIVRALEQLPHPRTDDVMIIRQKDADFGF